MGVQPFRSRPPLSWRPPVPPSNPRHKWVKPLGRRWAPLGIVSNHFSRDNMVERRHHHPGLRPAIVSDVRIEGRSPIARAGIHRGGNALLPVGYATAPELFPAGSWRSAFAVPPPAFASGRPGSRRRSYPSSPPTAGTLGPGIARAVKRRLLTPGGAREGFHRYCRC